MRRLSCLLWIVACSPGALDAPAVPNSTQDAPETTPTVAPTSTSPHTDTAPVSAENQHLITLFVHERRVDCHGEMPKKCLQVRRDGEDDWTYFYDTIAGFDYEESYRYELRVHVEKDENPPADKSSLSYRLVDVVSKQKIDPETP
jgi:hypothetical protein